MEIMDSNNNANNSNDHLKSSNQGLSPQQRVVLNVGGRKFETYVSTLLKYPNSLLGAMFHERNAHLLKPDFNGEYFFDRSPVAFESILNFYRTGKLRSVPGLSRGALEDEVDYWQLPSESIQDEEKIGTRYSYIALEAIRQKAEALVEKIKAHIIEKIQQASLEGTQSFTIEFKESEHEYYGFLSNFSNRELLLHDLLQENFDVSFNDMTSVMGHSYILNITLWNRYTRAKYGESTSTALSKILEELRQGVEIKTSKDAHILTVKPIFN
mmetsp:Transcript_5803/g.8121  ORF Transcript_5803/g.8121 Transcript_5803/m.8121 type:complete len:269 (-) Transcript_5803:26-832(-)